MRSATYETLFPTFVAVYLGPDQRQLGARLLCAENPTQAGMLAEMTAPTGTRETVIMAGNLKELERKPAPRHTIHEPELSEAQASLG